MSFAGGSAVLEDLGRAYDEGAALVSYVLDLDLPIEVESASTLP